jgi:hypothetical protein
MLFLPALHALLSATNELNIPSSPRRRWWVMESAIFIQNFGAEDILPPIHPT